MSWNLLVWKWSDDLNTTSKKRQHKMSEVAVAFSENGDHPAIGEADFSVYLGRVMEMFGSDEQDRPFVIEENENGIVFNYGSESRVEIVPILGSLASSLGFNATEF